MVFLFTLKCENEQNIRFGIMYDLNQFRLSKNNYSVNLPHSLSSRKKKYTNAEREAKKKLFRNINCSANIPGNSIPIWNILGKNEPDKMY